MTFAPALPRRPRFIRTVFLLLLIACMPVAAQEEPPWLPGILAGERLTVVVTDSGLGGLSVVADAAEKFRRHGVFGQVDLVFVNALFREQGGYNSLRREEKRAVFSSALQSMRERFDPDLVMVACNTLSVLVPDTEFAREGTVPVAGIVEQGVEQIAGQLQGRPESRNIIFATQTTVDEGMHRQMLLDRGVVGEQVITQSCPQLTAYIEQGYDAMDTELLIDAYVDEALTRAGEIDGPLSVSFACTHFGYSLASWKLAFESRGIEVTAYLDPNTRMVDFLLPADLQGRHPQPEVNVSVYSMIEIPEASIDSIGRYLSSVSPATESALRGYRLEPDLFEWRGLVVGGTP